MAYVFQTVDIKATVAKVRQKAPDLLSGRDGEKWTLKSVKALLKDAGIEPVYHGLWRFQYTDHLGRKRTVTGCDTEAKTRKKAARMEAHVRDIRDGIKAAPKASDIPQDFTDTVSEYVAWGKMSGGRRGFGWSKQHAKQRDFALNWWAKRLNLKTVADIRLPSAEKTLRELSKRLHAKTVQGYAEALKAFSLWCVKRQYLDADPLKGLRKLDTTPKTPHRPLSPAEAQLVISKAPPERQLLYRVALATGYRANELRTLKVASFDRFGPALTLPASATKNRQASRQFIPEGLAKEIAALCNGRKENEPLLVVPQKNTVTENFHRDRKRAGLPWKTPVGRLTFHSLRVTYIQTIVEAGADVKTAMEAARHGTAEMTFQRYAKPNADRLRALAEATEKALNRTQESTMEAQREATSDQPITQTVDSEGGSEAVDWLPGQDSNLSERKSNAEGAAAPDTDSSLKTRNGSSSEGRSLTTESNRSEHNRSTMAPDLQELADLWDRLPEAVRASFIAKARAATKGQKE